MSTVGVSWGRASSSCQVHRFGSFTFPSIEKSHRSRGVCGVGPAERTGKPRSRYCPGGSRPETSLFWRRPRNAREMNPSLISSPPVLLSRHIPHCTTSFRGTAACAAVSTGPFKLEAFYRSSPVFRVSPQATHEKQEKRVFARTPRAPARGLLPLATPLSRLLNRPAV